MGFSVLFALVFVGVWFWLFSVVTDATLSTIKASLTDTVNGAVAGVNGDEFAALVREGQPNAAGLSDDPRYTEVMAWLNAVHSLDPHASPYTYVPGPDSTGQPVSQSTAQPSSQTTPQPSSQATTSLLYIVDYQGTDAPYGPCRFQATLDA